MFLLSGAGSRKQKNVQPGFQQFKAYSDGAQNCGPSERKEMDRDSGVGMTIAAVATLLQSLKDFSHTYQAMSPLAWGLATPLDRDKQQNNPAKEDRDCLIALLLLQYEKVHPFMVDNNMQFEITEITEKGGLSHTEAVYKLVCFMQLDQTERKMDLAEQARVADIITATENPTCLSRFLQLRGHYILNDWLQETQKGESAEGGSPKESDKPIKELVLALIRALAKLPVSLTALRSCSIGISINHLCSHKDLEIQRKAKCLLDCWKERVDHETKWTDVSNLKDKPHVNNQQMLRRKRKEKQRQTKVEFEGEKRPKVFTLEEVAKHNFKHDCWVLIAGKVYDVTKFLVDHPGGAHVLLSSTAKDATNDFEDAGHNSTARAMMDEYCIGQIDTTTIPPKQSNYEAYNTGEHDAGQSSLSSKSISTLLSSSEKTDQVTELKAL
ncbi:uncharacterized protein [Triticum aestivum]|uniref:uncharacterized protein n=1 Tax=Triticum aestivum TaxID=4565 RepID=UPI001D01C956|nr:uncharacterized protein LOC123059635 [Triticum aestivum]